MRRRYFTPLAFLLRLGSVPRRAAWASSLGGSIAQAQRDKITTKMAYLKYCKLVGWNLNNLPAGGRNNGERIVSAPDGDGLAGVGGDVDYVLVEVDACDRQPGPVGWEPGIDYQTVGGGAEAEEAVDHDLGDEDAFEEF